MRVLSALLFALPALGQYSEGWKPGQARSSPTASVNSVGWDPRATGRRPSGPSSQNAPKAERGAPGSNSAGGIVDKILTSGPLASLFSSAGVNISEKLAEAHEAQAKMWDLRIPLLHDANYEELIVNETLSEEEERDRAWFIIITAQASSDTMSKFADQRFDELHNYTLEQGGLPHIRFARIDYLNVTYLTTKWNVWRAPFYVILKDRGHSLRFYRATQMRADVPTMYRFLSEQVYLSTPPWTSPFAPGGKYENYIHHFARLNEKVYDRLVVIPRWLFIAITGVIGTVLIQLMHRGDAKKEAEAKMREQKRRVVEAAKVGPTATTTPAASSTAVKTETPKKRKPGKK